jgi:thymidylate synthase|tara:strand:+ start:598 stop:1521 length:924 start_codon:yes stop_codon:yes gene_type:complete
MLSIVTSESSKRDSNGKNHEENQYLKLINDIIENGTMETGRNGNVKTIFGAAMHFSLENNKIPILTTKKVAWKTCLKELIWFIKGSTDNNILREQNVGIWNGNASREFLDSRNLVNNKEDDLGPIYGHQWRYFNADYIDCNSDYTDKGVDQLEYIITSLKHPTERFSRRLIMSAWNPQQLDEMALPPCHVLCQFCVTDTNKLSCSLYQRSGDIGLGVPFNIASYALLTHLIAKHCNLVPYQFVYFLGNAHIYDDHIESLKTQVQRVPYEFPTLEIQHVKSNIEDYTIEDFKLINYNYSDKISMKMRK